MKYVKNDGADVFSASDTACAGTETGYAGCIHAGQMRKVQLPGITSCAGLSMTDALGVFVWSCLVKNGLATFYSTDFQQGKGLQNLVNSTSWLSNSVTLGGASGNIGYSGTSASSVWSWTNPIATPASNPLAVDAQVSLSTSGTIYVVASNATTSGYAINADQVALITLPGVTLTYAGESSGWCASGAAYPIVCVNSHLYDWVEGNYEATPPSGTTANDGVCPYIPTFARFHLITVKDAAGYGGMMGGSVNTIFDQIRVSNNPGGGFGLDRATNDFVKDVVAVSNGNNGIAVENLSGLPTGNILFQVSAANNANGLLLDGDNGSLVQYVGANSGNVNLQAANLTGNIVVAATLNNGAFGTYLNGSTFYTLNNIVASNNSSSGIGLESDFNMTLSQVVSTDNAFGVSQDVSTSDYFTGVLMVGNDPSGLCNIIGSTPGLINNTCSSAGTDGSVVYAGQLSNATLRTARSLASSFFGKVTTTDSSNSSNVNGTATYPGTLDSFDFYDFSNFFRGWGLDGGTFPSAGNQGQWTAGTGRIWDWRLLASDTTILNKSGNGSSSNGTFVSGTNCPSAVNGNVTATDQSGRTYLLNAYEIVDPFNPYYSNTGNHNGLCEAGETCVYMPNFGAYQGEGTLEPCTFVSNGGLAGITMYGYSKNGD